MRRVRLSLTIACLLLGFQTTFAQLFEYNKEKIDNRQFEDACIEYVRDFFNVGDKKINILGMSHYPLSNGNTFVFLRVKWVALTYYEEYQVPGSRVWSSNKTETVYQKNQIEDAKRLAVVVNPNGFVKSWFKIPNNFSIWNLSNGILCFLIDKSELSVNGIRYTPYNYVNCIDYEGNILWEAGNDMMAFELIKTENNLYIGGEKVGDEARSLVRGYDIKTGKVVCEKVGNKGGICLGLKEGDNGLEYIEYLTGTNTSKSFSIPYEENDIASHRHKIMSHYDQNKADDQVQIGERYLNGNGFNKDEKIAFNWFKKAADQNNGKGLERLAYCYKNGLGVNQDKAKAVFYYEEAAKVGNTDAMADVVKMYVDGDGIPNNMSRVLYWQETLAFKGDKESQKYVISHQTIEHEMPGISSDAVHKLGMDAYKASDYEWAKFCFERGLSLGNKQSQLYLGIMYMQGQGVYHNYAKAIDYMKDLAEAGDVAAQCNIATMYKHGDVENGINRDEKKYVFWLNLASENGDKDAQYEMAQRYENGLLVKKDKKKAVELYEKVAKNYQEVKIKLIYMYAAGKGVKKDQERALYFFESLPADVEGEVADNIFWGNSGAKKDKKFGLELYKKAAARGNQEALKSYQLWSK